MRRRRDYEAVLQHFTRRGCILVSPTREKYAEWIYPSCHRVVFMGRCGHLSSASSLNHYIFDQTGIVCPLCRRLNPLAPQAREMFLGLIHDRFDFMHIEPLADFAIRPDKWMMIKIARNFALLSDSIHRSNRL